MRTADLDKLAEVCRRHGITEYQVTEEGRTVSLKFSPIAPVAAKPAEDEKTATTPKPRVNRPNGYDLALNGVS